MKAIKLLLVVLAMVPSLALGSVNLKNGNFYTTYTDIIVPGGMDLEIVRTYNSKATRKGWFGFGWGNSYETYLVVAADGSVTVHENGSGARTRFVPKAKIDPVKAADKIIAAIRKKSALSDNNVADLKKKLVGDANLRLAYTKRYKVSSKLADGTKLFSNTRGLQEITVSAKGYKRSFNDGKSEFFNKSGKLVRIENKNGYFVKLNYKKNKLASIKDSLTKELFFEWYQDGKVKHIYSADDKEKTFYKYKGVNLTESTDIAGNTFKYKYDSNHNMTEIGYSDKTTQKISYMPKTLFVKNVTSRDGNSTSYDYGSNPKDPNNHYWTTVTKVRSGSKRKEVNKYEYEIRSKPDGAKYTYRIATTINGLKTETVYSECCSLPLKITRGNNTTVFEYNSKGLLTKKASSKGGKVELEYHKKFNKITKVVNSKGWTKFSYDKKGNLDRATNKAGKSVALFYDRKGRIKKMFDKDRRTNKTRILSFQYNSLGKPVEISMKGIGKINVAYDNYGEIKKVKSDQGHKMALQVTQAFQSLLAIVKPAGVNLNM